METFCMVVLGGEYVTTYCWRPGMPTRWLCCLFFCSFFCFCDIMSSPYILPWCTHVKLTPCVIFQCETLKYILPYYEKLLMMQLDMFNQSIRVNCSRLMQYLPSLVLVSVITTEFIGRFAA